MHVLVLVRPLPKKAGLVIDKISNLSCAHVEEEIGDMELNPALFIESQQTSCANKNLSISLLYNQFNNMRLPIIRFILKRKFYERFLLTLMILTIGGMLIFFFSGMYCID